MARKKHTAEQIIAKLSEAYVALASGKAVAKSAEGWRSPSRRTTGGARSMAG
jgi:hypothetical protein